MGKAVKQVGKAPILKDTSNSTFRTDKTTGVNTDLKLYQKKYSGHQHFKERDRELKVSTNKIKPKIPWKMLSDLSSHRLDLSHIHNLQGTYQVIKHKQPSNKIL